MTYPQGGIGHEGIIFCQIRKIPFDAGGELFDLRSHEIRNPLHPS
jgi:hypothetical protein